VLLYYRHSKPRASRNLRASGANRIAKNAGLLV
jgi:hypothetical protein